MWFYFVCPICWCCFFFNFLIVFVPLFNWFIKQSKDGDSKRRHPTNRFRFPKYRIAIRPGVFPLSLKALVNEDTLLPMMFLGLRKLGNICCGQNSNVSKGGEVRDTKILNLSRNIVSLQGLVGVSRFSPCLMNLARNKNICCGLKKCGALIGWFARARANLSRDKLWVWWKTSNKAKLCCSK